MVKFKGPSCVCKSTMDQCFKKEKDNFMFCKVIEICKIQFILFLHTSGNKFLLGTVARHHLLQPKLIISLLSRIILMLVSEHFQRSLVPTPKCISMFPRSNQLTKVGVMFANKSLCGRDILTLSSEEGRDPGQTWQ